MPTCSQAKIITNLESDIHKRFFKLSNDSSQNFQQQCGDPFLNNESNECFYSIANKVNQVECIELHTNNTTNHPSHPNHNNNSITYTSNNKSHNQNQNQFYTEYCKSNSTLTKSANQPSRSTSYYTQNYLNQFVNQQRKQKTFIDYLVPQTKANYQYQQQHLQQQYASSAKLPSSSSNNRLKNRRISIDELPVSQNFETHLVNKIPILFGDFVAKKETVPINFLYNSPFRNQRHLMTVNQARINSLRTSLNLKASSGSDGEDGEEASSGISESNTSDKNSSEKSGAGSEKSSSSSPVNIIKLNPFSKLVPRKSIDHTMTKQQSASKRNIIDEIKQLNNNKPTQPAVSVQNELSSVANTFNIASNNLDVRDVSHRKLSGLLSKFPKLVPTEADSTENESNSDHQLNYTNLTLTTEQPTAAIAAATAAAASSSDHSADPNAYLKRLSLQQAKRLLALASIRPSKTFHKSMTEEEIEVLKKYYELIKPKVNTNSNTNSLDAEKYSEPYLPIVYDTAKVKFTSLQLLKDFIEKNKKDIDSNVYKIEYENGFLLKSQQDDVASIKFPSEINDAMFALTITASDKETSRLGEANLYRIINWNDTSSASIVNNAKHAGTSAAAAAAIYTSKEKNKLVKLSSINETNSSDNKSSSISSSSSNNGNSSNNSYYNIGSDNSNGKLNTIESNHMPSNSSATVTSLMSSLTLPSLQAKPGTHPHPPKTSSTSNSSHFSNTHSHSTQMFTFDFIKNLSGLVSSVVQPKLQKQLEYNGVDISTLPGGVNFDIPTFEELGINLNSLLSDNQVANSTNINLNTNGQASQLQQTGMPEYQNAKLKNTAYKKLKEKVNANKCMWFNSAPERRQLDVIFEYAGVDMEHQTVLDEVNKYLKEIGGYVKSVEFIPRSVHMGSVYVENQWILSLSDPNTKFFTITNGIQIKEEKITVKSYDEFIFSEYERFVRNEKYKQLIKNHEKAVQLTKSKEAKAKK